MMRLQAQLQREENEMEFERKCKLKAMDAEHQLHMMKMQQAHEVRLQAERTMVRILNVSYFEFSNSKSYHIRKLHP